MANQIDSPQPPVLPTPSQNYTSSVFIQKDNVLRLFFNRITTVLRNILSSTEYGGKFLYVPVGLFYSTQTQQIATVNTPQAITLNQTYISKGISIVDNSKIKVDNDGVYNFQISLELDKQSASSAIAYVWIRKNGTDTQYSTHTYHLSGSDAALEANWVFNYDMVAGDYIQMILLSNDTDVFLSSEAQTSPHVGIPSVVAAVNFVSNY